MKNKERKMNKKDYMAIVNVLSIFIALSIILSILLLNIRLESYPVTKDKVVKISANSPYCRWMDSYLGRLFDISMVRITEMYE